MTTRVSCTLAAAAALLLGPLSFAFTAQEKQQATATPIQGEWRLNKELSDSAPSGSSGGRAGGYRGGGGGGGGRRGGGGGGGRGGFGGGFGGGGGRGGFGGGGGAPQGNPEDMQRMRDALRAIYAAPDRMTIVRTDTMVIVTNADGQTTRLSTDDKKVKDDSTGITRKSKFDGDKLVSEITGAGPAKLIQTYAVDTETHRLVITIHPDDKNDTRPGAKFVYDPAPQS